MDPSIARHVLANGRKAKSGLGPFQPALQAHGATVVLVSTTRGVFHARAAPLSLTKSYFFERARALPLFFVLIQPFNTITHICSY
jgi:hypothetical protein